MGGQEKRSVKLRLLYIAALLSTKILTYPFNVSIKFFFFLGKNAHPYILKGLMFKKFFFSF